MTSIFWRSILQNKALFNQNKSHLGSRYILWLFLCAYLYSTVITFVYARVCVFKKWCQGMEIWYRVFPGHKIRINMKDFRVGFQVYTPSPECTLFSRHHCSPPIGPPASLPKICMPETCERPLNWAIEPLQHAGHFRLKSGSPTGSKDTSYIYSSTTYHLYMYMDIICLL